jgi:hypothetical protein
MDAIAGRSLELEGVRSVGAVKCVMWATEGCEGTAALQEPVVKGSRSAAKTETCGRL